MSTGSTRRSLFAGIAAVVMGSGITAGAATSVANLVPPDSDAQLIALCDRFCAIERRHYLEAWPFWTVGDDHGADAAMARMSAELELLVDLIVDLPPHTLQGAAALAQALEAWTHGDFASHGNTDDLLARTLLRGLLGSA